MSEIIIAGPLRIHPDDRQAAMDAAAEAIAAARAQPGCIAYAWTADNLEDDLILIYERWTDQESLAAHLAGPCYQATRQALFDFRILGAEPLKFRIDKSEPVYDETHTPRADFFTD